METLHRFTTLLAEMKINLKYSQVFMNLTGTSLRYFSKDSFAQRSQGNRQGKDEAEARELLPVRLIIMKIKKIRMTVNLFSCLKVATCEAEI